MKNVFLLLAIALNSFVFASAALDQAAQEEIVSFIAKVERKYLWRAGYQNVSSNFSKLSQSSFSSYLDRVFEHDLDKSEIQEIRSCLEAKDCAAYNISIQSEYHSGYGVDSVFVLINLNSGKYNADIKHNVYSE
ncbi:hypothetical protein [Halobacteriovorax sp. YZS-1-1]|uniref:hypothetical protein n=1 Tax=unclassified Halobacteriovorax TaxID=2639665 RepID=UPI00399AD9E0